MWRCIGQDRAIAALRRDLETGRTAHAYLFTGTPRIGKATLAREFAQALNCESHPNPAQAGPCGTCRACTRIAEGRHADIEVLTSHSPCETTEHDHSRDASPALRICQVRRIERVVAQTPYEGRTRVIIVDPADALTLEAANAFLKTLEEPPPNCVLVLLAVDPEALPATVRSRCRTIALQPAPTEALRRTLVEQWGASAEEAERLSRLAQGRPGWARAALDDEGLVEERFTLLRRIESLTSAPRDERLAYAESLAERWPGRRDEVGEELETWQTWWREIMLDRAGRDDLTSHHELADAMRVAAAKFETHAIAEFIEAIRRAVRQLEANANPRLTLDVLMLSLPAASAGRPREQELLSV